MKTCSSCLIRMACSILGQLLASTVCPISRVPLDNVPMQKHTGHSIAQSFSSGLRTRGERDTAGENYAQDVWRANATRLQGHLGNSTLDKNYILANRSVLKMCSYSRINCSKFMVEETPRNNAPMQQIFYQSKRKGNWACLGHKCLIFVQCQELLMGLIIRRRESWPV